ncbi:hypothetical protein CC99x_005890 [Candidatus Berkiella cookevillensis]|uniref:Uncharacterized protein n=1 Tax=Candidatus Berkiella cookevillensis TaxID=437022 RepID=A0A0Q9YSS1_9GAMM|nr:hypothetical protein [Candidatus Berkiella cookevillensis]MCS5708435.1 hypothetical protein [Candidatus Berkiella cookevillensis]
MKAKMTQTIFENIILSYGAKPHHWPLDMKDDIHAWIEQNPATTSFLNNEHSFESILDSYEKPIADKNYDANIQCILNKIKDETTFPLQNIFLPLIPKISILALSLLLGISIGIYSPPEDVNTINSNELLNTAFSYTFNDSEINL